jgi:hypothetical protein
MGVGHALERVRLPALAGSDVIFDYAQSLHDRMLPAKFPHRVSAILKNNSTSTAVAFLLALAILLAAFSLPARAQTKSVWKSVAFAIVKLDDGPPKSWNMYHTEKHGVLLVRIWKRYLLIDMNQQEVYDIDPTTVKPNTESVDWSPANKPSEPLDITEWKERNVGSMDRLRFRLPKQGAVIEIQVPLRPDGKSLY